MIYKNKIYSLVLLLVLSLKISTCLGADERDGIYISNDYGFSFFLDRGFLAIDRYNQRDALVTPGLSRQTYKLLTKFGTNFRAILIENILCREYGFAINNLKETFEYYKIKSLNDHLLNNEREAINKNILFVKDIIIGKSGVSVTRYVRNQDLKGERREVYNSYFEYKGVPFVIQMIHNPMSDCSKATLVAYEHIVTRIK